MKPRIFIGSSTESLPIAYAIQENLQHESDTTVWSQGIFKLSSNTIEDLLTVLENIDYGIFVFSPDDLITIREKQLSITRDNVIFELGLFIGRLGKQKVFYVVPNETDTLHIPSDLIGIAPGKYHTNRNDGNLAAALGPFCNQVRERIKNFVYENIQDLANESKEAKRLAIEKPKYWEYLLLAELIERKLTPIIEGYEELNKGLKFTPTVTSDNFIERLNTISADFQKLSNLFIPLFAEELRNVIKDEGTRPIEIKNYSEKLIRYSKELLEWEYRHDQLQYPEGLSEAKNILKGLSSGIFSPISKMPAILRNRVKAKINGDDLTDPSLMLHFEFEMGKFSELKPILEKYDLQYLPH